MLGVIHRTIIGKGPAHFKEHFKLTKSGKLQDPREQIGGRLIQRSALGLVAIYNKLPDQCKKAKTVKEFQTALQEMQRVLATAGLPFDIDPREFVRVAAPTGTAAFNIRFNATTLHRLMHWFTPPYFKPY